MYSSTSTRPSLLVSTEPKSPSLNSSGERVPFLSVSDLFILPSANFRIASFAGGPEGLEEAPVPPASEGFAITGEAVLEEASATLTGAGAALLDDPGMNPFLTAAKASLLVMRPSRLLSKRKKSSIVS